MGVLKYAILGAAVAYGINHITQKRESDGKSILDDIQEKAPEWIDHIKAYADDALKQASNSAQRAKQAYENS